MTAYYNEIDPFAAAWLRELINAGEIAPGDVDTRSIVDVRPVDLIGYTQCHFFAGIGVWSHALRRAGWPDDCPVWTGSCPCQPFSAAGKGGGFDDERHLWPAWFHLIEQCRPATILGEQVASRDGLGWLDLVQSDLEGAGYACGAVDLCAAGVGAPHIRQRLWFVANRLADATSERRDGLQGSAGAGGWAGAQDSGGAGGLADANNAGSQGRREPGGQRPTQQLVGPGGVAGGLADADGRHASAERQQPRGEHGQQPEDGGAAGGGQRPGPVNGFWRDADWLHCRDGKWRPVGPGTFPLVDGAPARVGRLRGYGNAIPAEAATQIVRAVM